MSFNSYLEGLRAKPEHVRKRIAFWSSFGLTAIIFAFWSASFANTAVRSSDTVAAAVEKTQTPGQSLVAAAGSFVNAVTDHIFGPKKVTYSSVEVSGGDK